MKGNDILRKTFEHIDVQLAQQLQTYIDENFVDEPHKNISGIFSALGVVALGAIINPKQSKIDRDDFEYYDEHIDKSTLEKILSTKKPAFADVLTNFIDERGLNDPQVYNKAGISRQLFHKIISIPNYKPSKETVLMLALALKLNVDETKYLLDAAGFSLSRSIKRDVILNFFISIGKYSLILINDALNYYGEPTIGM